MRRPVTSASRRRSGRLASALILVIASLWIASSAAGQPEPLPGGWKLYKKAGPFMGAVAVACSRDAAFARSWGGDVGYFDGSRWHKLPAMPGNRRGGTYGRTLAVSPDGEELFVEASNKVARWDGERWSMLKLPAWRGPLAAMTVLPSKELLVVGDGRIGRRAGSVIKSHDAGTWRALRAVAGAGPGALYTAGQGGTVMHFDGKRWSRMKTGATAFFLGLHLAGKGHLWAWSGIRRRSAVLAVMRFDGHRWSRAEQGLKSPLLGMAGEGARPWAVGQSFVARREGSSWVTKLTTTQLGPGHHRLVGICATSKFLYVGTSSGHSLAKLLR